MKTGLKLLSVLSVMLFTVMMLSGANTPYVPLTFDSTTQTLTIASGVTLAATTIQTATIIASSSEFQMARTNTTLTGATDTILLPGFSMNTAAGLIFTVNGLMQDPTTDYILTGSYSLLLATPAASGSRIQVVKLN